jgi:hypothetical protein
MKTKNIFSIISTLFILSLLTIFCTKERELPINNKLNIKNGINKDDVAKITYHVVYATWDEWGRMSLDCDGFGLCNFVTCFNCCTDDFGNIVDCPTNSKLPRTGKIIYIKGQSQSTMEVKLNPQFSDEANAISRKDTLHIDNNLENVFCTIKSGKYIFNPSIGEFGGYSVDVLIK